MDSVNGKGLSVSDGMVAIGRLFTIAVTYDIRVTSNSWVSGQFPRANSRVSRMHRIVLI